MTRDELLKHLAQRVLQLEARVDELEDAKDDGWDDPFSLGPIAKSLADASPMLKEPWDPPKPRAMWQEGDTLHFLPPTENQRKLRERLTKHLHFENWTLGDEGSVPLDEAEAVPAYVAGGPLWLYSYDREFVMSLPVSTRQAMVTDVQSVDPEAAGEFARDVLKDEGVGLDPETGSDIIEQTEGQKFGGSNSGVTVSA